MSSAILSPHAASLTPPLPDIPNGITPRLRSKVTRSASNASAGASTQGSSRSSGRQSRSSRSSSQKEPSPEKATVPAPNTIATSLDRKQASPHPTTTPALLTSTTPAEEGSARKRQKVSISPSKRTSPSPTITLKTDIAASTGAAPAEPKRPVRKQSRASQISRGQADSPSDEEPEIIPAKKIRRWDPAAEQSKETETITTPISIPTPPIRHSRIVQTPKPDLTRITFRIGGGSHNNNSYNPRHNSVVKTFGTSPSIERPDTPELTPAPEEGHDDNSRQPSPSPVVASVQSQDFASGNTLVKGGEIKEQGVTVEGFKPDQPKRAARKKRKWLKKGEVDPEDPIAVARQKERHAMIDEAVINLDNQEEMIKNATNEQLLEMERELRRRADLQLKRLEARQAAELGDLKKMRDHSLKQAMNDWKFTREELVNQANKDHLHTVSQMERERVELHHVPGNKPNMRFGQGDGGWDISSIKLLSKGTLDTAPVMKDGEIRQRRNLPGRPMPIDPDEMEDDLAFMGIQRDTHGNIPDSNYWSPMWRREKLSSRIKKIQPPPDKGKRISPGVKAMLEEREQLQKELDDLPTPEELVEDHFKYYKGLLPKHTLIGDTTWAFTKRPHSNDRNEWKPPSPLPRARVTTTRYHSFNVAYADDVAPHLVYSQNTAYQPVKPPLDHPAVGWLKNPPPKALSKPTGSGSLPNLPINRPPGFGNSGPSFGSSSALGGPSPKPSINLASSSSSLPAQPFSATSSAGPSSSSFHHAPPQLPYKPYRSPFLGPYSRPLEHFGNPAPSSSSLASLPAPPSSTNPNHNPTPNPNPNPNRSEQASAQGQNKTEPAPNPNPRSSAKIGPFGRWTSSFVTGVKPLPRES